MNYDINKKKQHIYIIGIDTGINTGFAVWSVKEKKLIELKTYKIHKAISRVIDYEAIAGTMQGCVFVRFEDARLRKWYGKQAGTHALQGAGSIKRDCVIWEDFLIDYMIHYQAVHPLKNMTKLNAEQFKQITGYTGRTNVHERDAAMLVFKFIQ